MEYQRELATKFIIFYKFELIQALTMRHHSKIQRLIAFMIINTIVLVLLAIFSELHQKTLIYMKSIHQNIIHPLVSEVSRSYRLSLLYKYNIRCQHG
jgi:hypothetical protein